MPKDIFQLANDKFYESKSNKRKELPEIANENDSLAEEKENSHLVCFGSRNSGKSSLILRFLDRDEGTKPTIALEYTYGRRAKGNVKEVGHIWELGGSVFLLDLLNVPLKPQTIPDTCFIIFVDLSKPAELWVVLERCLQAGRQAVEVAVQKGSPELKSQLLKASWARVGEEHQDKAILQPFAVPCSIVGGHYDAFQSFDPEQKKIICKTLRFLAHLNGATLQFYSTKIEALVTKGRVLVSHMLFRTAASKTATTDHTKPLFIPCGSDSFSEIGPPPVENIQQISASNPLDLWRAAYESVFPQIQLKREVMEDPSKDPQFREPAIDLLKENKDQEFAKFMKEKARKMKTTSDDTA